MRVRYLWRGVIRVVKIRKFIKCAKAGGKISCVGVSKSLLSLLKMEYKFAIYLLCVLVVDLTIVNCQSKTTVSLTICDNYSLNSKPFQI